MPMFTINELSQRDWREYKSIRLKSLKDSPDSFASTYELEAAFTSEQWKSRLGVSSNIHSAVALAAIDDQSYIGLLSSVIPKSDTRIAHLYQMWVNPRYRGKGVGNALVNRVKAWAINSNAKTLQLSVTTSNSDAISLYQSIGFYALGGEESLREGSSLRSQTMEFTLNTIDT